MYMEKILISSLTIILMASAISMVLPSVYAQVCDTSPTPREFDIEPYYTGPLVIVVENH